MNKRNANSVDVARADSIESFDGVWKDDAWNEIVRRAAATSSKRLTRGTRWEKRVRTTNRALIAVGILLVVQFCFSVIAQQKILDSTNAYWLTTFVSTSV